MNKTTTLLVLLLPILTLVTLLPPRTHAFWGEGHMLVSAVAAQNLTAAALAKADALVGQSGALYASTPSFVSSAVWMDEIKPSSHAFHEWHYITLPYTPTGFSPVPPTPEPNAVTALNDALASLDKGEADPWAWAFALRVTTHIVGDLHQPCHCCSLFDDSFPYGDLGGNRFDVLYKEESTNLHTLFDSVFFNYNTRYALPLSTSSKTALEQKAKALMAANVPSITPQELADLDPGDWAPLCHDNAVRYAYLNGSIAPGDVYPQAAADAAVLFLHRNIVLGGLRLAALLQDRLDALPDPTPPSPSPSPSPPPPPSSSSVSVGVFTAGTLGGLVVGCIAGALGYMFISRRKETAEAYAELDQ